MYLAPYAYQELVSKGEGLTHVKLPHIPPAVLPPTDVLLILKTVQRKPRKFIPVNMIMSNKSTSFSGHHVYMP